MECTPWLTVDCFMFTGTWLRMFILSKQHLTSGLMFAHVMKLNCVSLVSTHWSELTGKHILC